MEKVTATTPITPFLNVIDSVGRMRNRLGSLWHDDEYVTIKNVALADGFGTGKLLINSVFLTQYSEMGRCRCCQK